MASYRSEVLGLEETPRWRENVARRVENAWKVNGEVWLSHRLCAGAPAADGTWAEGDDARLAWTDPRSSAGWRSAPPWAATTPSRGYRSPANERTLLAVSEKAR